MTGRTLEIDQRSLMTVAEKIDEDILNISRFTMQITARELEEDLEALTRSAVGGKLWRAWTSQVYPKQGLARSPSALVYPKGGERTRGAMKFFATSGRIRPKGGEILWVPLPSAGRRSRVPHFTPKAWELARGVKLKPIFRPGKRPLLVWDRGDRDGAGERKFIPIFVGMSEVDFQKRFSIDPAVQSARRRVSSNFREVANRYGY